MKTEEFESTQSVCPNCGELHESGPFIYCPTCMGYDSFPKKFDFRRFKVDFVAKTIRGYYVLIPSINVFGLDLWPSDGKYGTAIEFRWIIWGFGWRFYNEAKTV